MFSLIFAKAVVKCWFPCLISAASAHNLNTNVWFADSSLSAAPFNRTFFPTGCTEVSFESSYWKHSPRCLFLQKSQGIFKSACMPVRTVFRTSPRSRAAVSALPWMARQLVCVWRPAQAGQTGGWTVKPWRCICGKESFHSSWWKDNFILAVRGYHSPLVLKFFKGLLSFHSHAAFRNVNLTIVPHYLGKGGGHCSLKDFMLLRTVS